MKAGAKREAFDPFAAGMKIVAIRFSVPPQLSALRRFLLLRMDRMSALDMLRTCSHVQG